MKRLTIAVLLLLVAAGAGCASKYTYRTVHVPPKVDLTEHDVIAVLEFESSSEGELAALATRRFTDLARRDQGLVRMMNLVEQVDRMDPAALRELGQRRGAQTMFVGTIEISDVRPNVSIANTLKSGSLTANVDATLTVDLVETESGASIWSASARTTKTVGHVSVFEGRHVTFDAEDPEQAYAPLIDALVAQVTADFRAGSYRQRVPR